MCLACYLGPGRTLTPDEIRTAWANNPDGAGFVYFADGAPVVYRTLHLHKFEAAYAQHAARGFGMAVHFRYATHGTTGVENVHPFRVNRHDWLLHNGVLPVQTDGKRSDTRTFAEDWLTQLPARWYQSPELTALVSEFATGSKLIIATRDPEASASFYVVNGDDGYWEDDRRAWFSNRSHCDARMPRGATAGSSWSLPSEWAASASARSCLLCGMGATDLGVCDACDACSGCLQDVADCACEPDGHALRMLELTDAEWDAYQKGTQA